MTRGVLLIIFAASICSCAPKLVEKIETMIEYRDRIVRDTAIVEIPYEVEKVVTRDTVSHLENTYAKSDAVVSGGFLTHSLESKPKIIEIPVEVHVTDTLYKESQIIEKEVKVEKTLTWWQHFRLQAFWWLSAALLCCLLWIFRKPILMAIKALI